VTIPNNNPLHNPRYPRSNNYDPQWILDNQMGPNALWLIEALTEVIQIKPCMRVLDLGCGTALTSIFLAKEFGAQVWATDLWIEASANQERIRAADVESLVVPIHAEAHALPFAGNFFDAIVSVDAYHYFGTDDLYLGYMVHFLREGDRRSDARISQRDWIEDPRGAGALLGVGLLFASQSRMVATALGEDG
jgi:cyclopropane fatty-acyl-phospholipid synthase-like methyltransferase